MKKLLVILLALAMVLSLAACASDSQDGQDPSDSTPGDANTDDGANTPDDANTNDGANTPDDANTNDGANTPDDGDTPDDGNTPDDGDTPDDGNTPDDTPEQAVHVNFAVLTGPTGIGAVKLMESNDNGESRNSYTVSALADNQQINAGLINGDFDIAAVATNVAATLYGKTQGGVQILALNTLGVLYVLENGDTVHSVADLKGKTIYSPGQGANPEYVLKYILTQNGLTVSTDLEPVEDADVQIVFDDASVIQTKMAAGEIDVAMLPIPAATAVQINNKDVRAALDMTAEWNALETGGQLTMGCVVVRTEFAQANPQAVESFLADYEASITAVKADPDGAAALCETYGIVPKAPIAKKAIVDLGDSLTYVAGADVRATIEPYYQVLFDANPASIGGAMPDDGFYWAA